MTIRRWSRLIRVRDGGICMLCNEKYNIWNLHAHHIYPKSLYLDKIYDLDNGITLCAPCHLVIVHRNDAVNDVSSDNKNSGWRYFLPAFNRYTHLASQRDKNEELNRRHGTNTES